MLAGKNTVVRVRDWTGAEAAGPQQYQDAQGWLDADHGDRRGRWAGALRVHLLGYADAQREGLAKGIRWPAEGENFLFGSATSGNTSKQPALAKVDIRIDPKAAYPHAGERPAGTGVDRSCTAATGHRGIAPGHIVFRAPPGSRFSPWGRGQLTRRTSTCGSADSRLLARRGEAVAKHYGALPQGDRSTEFAHVTQLIASDHGEVARRRGLLRRILYPRRGLSDHGIRRVRPLGGGQEVVRIVFPAAAA